jgi:hypothetical protein
VGARIHPFVRDICRLQTDVMVAVVVRVAIVGRLWGPASASRTPVAVIYPTLAT